MEIFIDIDDTLVFEDAQGAYSVCDVGYRLAHAAREFLMVLNSLQDVSINFFSANFPSRNEQLITSIAHQVSLLHYNTFSLNHLTSDLRKRLQDLKEGIRMESAVLIDDSCAAYSAEGEEINSLQIYRREDDGDEAEEITRVVEVRLKNNLIRALGLILWSIDISKQNNWTVVEALSTLQWSGGRYRHDVTNRKEIYRRGLQAMRKFNPELELVCENGVYPWSPDDTPGDFGFENYQVDRIVASLPKQDLMR